MIDEFSFIVLVVVLDAWLGDPVYPLHPIRVLGHWIAFIEQRLFTWGLDGYVGGVLLWLLVVGGALALWWAVHHISAWIAPWLAWLWDLYVAYSLVCIRDLLRHGRRVLDALDDLPNARERLSLLVGRDTDGLGRDGIVRASIESLSENLTDAVITPFWALCLFGLPGLIVVKAVSTLDSMVGYKTPRYLRFGWAGARSDDLVNWLPARLSVGLIVIAAWLLRFAPASAWRAAWRYHAELPSPNSGWSEAACAGALRVRLVGPIRYRGRLVNHAYLGDPDWPAALDAGDLARALRLLAVCASLAVAIGLGLVLVHGSESPGTVSTVPPRTGLLEFAAFEQKSAWYADFCSAALVRIA